MAEVRNIQCPSCGSNSTYRLFDGSYKCNYCQGSFIVNETRQQRPVPVNPVSDIVSSPASRKTILIVLAVSVFLGMGLVAFLITAVPGNSERSGIHKNLQAVKPPVVKKSMAFVGPSASVVWIITEKYLSRDSSYYELSVVNPQTHAGKGKETIGYPFRSMNPPDLNKELGSRFWQYGNLIYTILGDKALVAYNINTGKQELDNTSLAGQFPELKAGIMKVEYNSSGKVFNLVGKMGDVIRFDPRTRSVLITPDTRPKQKEAITKKLYLSDGLKHRLYLFTKRGNGFPIVFNGYVQESQLPSDISASKTGNVKDIFGNIHIERVSEKSFFMAQPLLSDTNGSLLLLYKTDLSGGSPVILESIDVAGNTNWSLQDSSLLKINKAIGSNSLGCEYKFSDRILIISISVGTSFGKCYYVAVDIQTGKVLWRFDPQQFIDKQKY